jgi:hypothetical protein
MAEKFDWEGLMLYINMCGLSALLLQCLAQFSLFHSYMIILLGLSKA